MQTQDTVKWLTEDGSSIKRIDIMGKLYVIQFVIFFGMKEWPEKKVE